MDRGEALLREVEPFATLAPVIAWALRQSPPAEFVQVVVQDEYTHDVVVAWSEGIYLVYDTT